MLCTIEVVPLYVFYYNKYKLKYFIVFMFEFERIINDIENIFKIIILKNT